MNSFSFLFLSVLIRVHPWSKRFFLLVLLLGSTASSAAETPPAPDFRLLDVNPNSIRQNSLVSPRDYVLQVSGYYFGAAG